ncbi:hypothetical protein [Methylocella sp.]|jgi:DNA-binding transcriptional regulator YiaG|uniref:hypothetical protein n=1 Tax=Methylocella sp. TaxID=1978226 RepID=UPI003C2A4027
MTNENDDDENSGKLITPPRRRRSARSSPPVTPEMIYAMRQMYKIGMAQHVIAAHFGVNQGRVSDAVNGKI